MKGTLYWKPCRRVKPLSDLLRDCITQRFWQGAERPGNPPIVIGRLHLLYFQGLDDAGIEGAEDIIAEIEDGGTVEIWIDGDYCCVDLDLKGG